MENNFEDSSQAAGALPRRSLLADSKGPKDSWRRKQKEERQSAKKVDSKLATKLDKLEKEHNEGRRAKVAAMNLESEAFHKNAKYVQERNAEKQKRAEKLAQRKSKARARSRRELRAIRDEQSVDKNEESEGGNLTLTESISRRSLLADSKDPKDSWRRKQKEERRAAKAVTVKSRQLEAMREKEKEKQASMVRAKEDFVTAQRELKYIRERDLAKKALAAKRSERKANTRPSSSARRELRAENQENH